MATAIGGAGGESGAHQGTGMRDFGRALIDLIEKAARLREKLVNALLGHKSSDDLGRIVRAGLAATTVGLTLKLLAALLQVPGGWGIEDFLGWIDIPGEAPGLAIRNLWTLAKVRPLADLYLALDTLLFVPAYAVLFLVAGRSIARGLAADSAAATDELSAPETVRNWHALLAIPTVALVAADLVENAIGIRRLAPSSYAMLLVLVVPALAILASVDTLRRALREITLLEVIGGLLLAALVCGLAGGLGDSCRTPSTPPQWVLPDSIGCAAHRGKFHLLAIAALVIVVCAGLWLFAVPADQRRPGLRPQRAELRSSIWDIFVRSRYVLATLALLIGLVLGLDQAQDVMYAVASAPWPDPAQHSRWPGWAGALLVYALAAASVWALGFACWLWSRSVCMVVAPGRAARVVPGPADLVARHWARLLGLVPYAVVFFLCLGVIIDSSKASYAAFALGKPTAAYEGTILSVVTFAIATIVLGLLYVRIRIVKTDTLYYNAIEWRDWATDAEFVGGMQKDGAIHKYRLLGVVTPYALPFVALAGAFVCRAVDLYPGGGAVPSMAFPVILFTLTVWLCFFGWLSMLEVVRAVPWVLVLLVLIGAFGVLGYSDNQRVWSPIVEGSGLAEPWARYRMLAFAGALAAIALAAYAVVMRLARTGAELSKLAVAGWWFLLAALIAAVMWLGDRYASYRTPKPLDAVSTRPATLGRPTLAQAMSEWLRQLCKDHAHQGCAAAGAGGSAAAAEPVPVYFVSTMGGGIRAAAWTAQVLQHLEEADPTFRKHTFSISGVSGGAVGAAVYRACGSAKGTSRTDCLAAFAHADLVSPLLSSWLFEDALARVIPTQWCSTPACGFLSRSAWFEGSMEAAVPGLRQGLWESRRSSDGFEPYLLLNSTWVETGERAIASDLQIHSMQFPGAKDQLAIADHDLPLGTAAHNAARFPYVNAIGQLSAPSVKCDMRADDELHADERKASGSDYGKRISCGHLADGGYFDNSGGQSSVDALNAMVRCLTVTKTSADRDLYAPCLDNLSTDMRNWLRASLVPMIVFIRNGVAPDAETASDCSRPEQPAATELNRPAEHDCVSLGPQYHPERTACRRNFTFYVDALGPPIALFNGAGTGAHGQLSEAGERRAVLAARAALALPAVAGAAGAASGASAAMSISLASAQAASGARHGTPRAPVITLDQIPDGIRYPLGWHLSRAAVAGLAEQARRCVVQ